MRQVGAGPPLQRIVVRRGPVALEALRRPLRRMPSGDFGAEYLGLVYPVDAAGQIDIDGVWCYPGQAPICLDPPGDVATPGERPYRLETDGCRPYLFLAGSAQRLARVVAELQAADFHVERWGRTFRPEFAAALPWYLRFPHRDEGRAPTGWEIDRALAAVEAVGAPTPDLSLASELDAPAIQTIVGLEQALAAEVEARDAAESRLTALRREFQRELARANDAAAFLRAALATLEKQLRAPQDGQGAAAPATGELQEALQRLNGELQQALSEWFSVEEQRQSAAIEIAELRARITELEGLVATAPSPAATSPSRSRSAAKDLAAALTAFAPEVRLARDSADFIAQEVSDKTDLLKKIRLIAQDRTALKAKRVQSADGWMEVHFSTGAARDGRLYFKNIDISASPGWLILVSDKAAQPRDFEWIAKQ